MRKLTSFFLLCAAFSGFLLLRNLLHEASAPPLPPAEPKRIVSLAPSVTETLYALGFGSDVVGVTTFCAWPAEVKNKPKVSEYSQLNLEALVRARPDLVVMPANHLEYRSLIEKMGIPVLYLSTLTLPDYVQAMQKLGQSMGHSEQAASVAEEFRRAIRDAEARAAGKKRPRILFSVMRSEEGRLGSISEISAVGNSGFYSDLLRLAGGDNVYTGTLAFLRLSREAVLLLDPDVIVDIIRPSDDAESVRRDWQSLHSVRAVRENRLVLLSGTEDTVPGPRSVITLSRLSKAFFPEEGPP